jgi:hypothetical protein
VNGVASTVVPPCNIWFASEPYALPVHIVCTIAEWLLAIVEINVAAARAAIFTTLDPMFHSLLPTQPKGFSKYCQLL